MNPSPTRTADPTPHEVLYPRGGVAVLRRPPALFGRPAALFYHAFSEGLRRRRTGRRPAPWEDTTVVAVGNLEMGGNGKTPLAVHLLQFLERTGQRPVYVSRGFASTAGRLAAVTVRAAWDGGRCPVRADGLRLLPARGPLGAGDVGDEGAMVAMRCPGTPLFFSRDKLRAIDLARGMFGPTHIILDDAFQSWRVPRDRDVVLLDAGRPFGNGRVVPAGTLREPPGALARADVIGINGCESREAPARYAEAVRGACGRDVPVFGIERSVVIVDLGKGERGPVAQNVGGGVAALSSVARPGGFERSLGPHTGGLALALRYPDHHRYRERDLADIRHALRERGITTLVTTDKDWVKLCGFDLSFTRVLVGRLVLAVDEAVLREITKKPQATPAASS
ncbi:MAG: tetraacyldisaccharide 4'-kinase [Candidatus Krumholzibacteriia bacterium]